MAESFALGIVLRLRDEASRGVKAALGGVERLGEQAEETHKKVAKLESGFRQLRDAGLALTGMGAAAAGALFAVVKPAAALEEQIRNALTVTGETGKAFARMEQGMTEQALRLSTKLGISADAVAEGFYQVLSTGAQALTPEFDALSETALKLAKTVGLGPADAVEVLSDTVNEFQLNMTEAARVADVFFTASKVSTLTVPQLVQSMREAGAAAGGLGIPLEDVAAVLAGFASKGVKGAKAGTAFRILLVRLAKPPDDAAKALRRLGVAVFDSGGKIRPLIDLLKEMQRGMLGMSDAQKAATLKAIAGEEAFAKLAGLLNSDLNVLEGWRTELKKGGAMELAFSQKMETLVEQSNVLWVSIKNLAISIGQPLLGALSGAAAWLAKVLQGVTDFTKAHPILGKVIGVTLAVVGVFGVLAGSILTVTGVLGLFTLKWLPLAKAGMATLSGAITQSAMALKGLVVATWAGIKAAVAWTAATVKDIAVKVAHVAAVIAGTVAAWATTAASKAAAIAQWLWNAAMMANPIGLIIVGVAALIAGIVLLVKNWDAVTGAVKGAFAWFKNLLGKTPDWLLAIIFPFGLIIKHFDKLKAAAGAVFGWLKSAVSSVVEWIGSNWGTIKDVLLAPIDFVVQGWTALKEGLVGIFTSVANTVTGVFSTVRDAIMGVINWLWDKVTWVISKIPDVFLPESLEEIKRARKAQDAGLPVGGQMVVPATAPAMERATARPTVPRDATALPAFAAASAGGSVDQSIVIQPGAIQIHAVRVDEEVVRRIDFELAKLIRRRQERR